MLKACRFSFYLLDSLEKWAFLTLPHMPLHILSCTKILCSLHSIQQDSLILGFLRDERLGHSLWICDNIITGLPAQLCTPWIAKMSQLLIQNSFIFLTEISTGFWCACPVYFKNSHILVWVSFLEGSLVF